MRQKRCIPVKKRMVKRGKIGGSLRTGHRTASACLKRGIFAPEPCLVAGQDGGKFGMGHGPVWLKCGCRSALDDPAFARPAERIAVIRSVGNISKSIGGKSLNACLPCKHGERLCACQRLAGGEMRLICPVEQAARDSIVNIRLLWYAGGICKSCPGTGEHGSAAEHRGGQDLFESHITGFLL